MKHIFILTASLFHIVCSADCAITIAPQQSWNAIIADSNVKIGHQSTDSTRAVYVSNQVACSTQHKSFRHHSSAPQYDLNRMNTKKLEWYFSANGYTEGEVLSHPMLYMNAAYLAIAKQLPRYSEFVEKYYKKYRHHKGIYAFWEIINFRYRDGMREKFTELYQECEEQRLAKETRERRDREEHEQKIKAAAAYCARFDQHTGDNITLDAVPYHHQQARNRAREQIKTTALDRVTRQHTVTQETITFVYEYDIAGHSLTSLHGNAYEHQLHTEFLEQLNEAHTISNYYALQPKNILIDAVCHGAAIGMEANRLQEPGIATVWANFGWKALDIIEGVSEGLVLFAENTTDMILHPRHTLEQLAHGLGMLTSLVARTCAYAMGIALYWNELMEHGDGLLMAQKIDQVAHKVSALGSYCIEKATSLEARDIAKYGTAIAADMILTHKIFVFGGTICTRATPIIRDAIAHASTRITAMGKTTAKALEIARAESPILQTAEGVLMKASEELNKVGGGAMEVLKSTRLVLETVHAEYMAHLEMELGALRLLFDNKVKGFAEFANKFIKIEYKHILGMNLVFDAQGRAKFSGFHHDLMNAIEKSGAIEFANKVMHKNGFYSADLIIDGMKTPKTFFPSEWPREKVVEKIYEAYHNFIKSGVIPKPRPNEKYLISGTIAEGIDIEMWVTKKGKVVTAYPLLK